MGQFEFVGVDALRERFIAALEEEIVEAADEVLTETKADTPEDTTKLMRSARTDTPRVGATQVSNRIVAGEGTDYGLIVHQKDAIHHRNGSAHFLAKPVLAYVPRLIERVREAGRKAY